VKAFIAFILLINPQIAIPEHLSADWWEPWNFGAPCTTKTDIAEGTCIIELKKINWK